VRGTRLRPEEARNRLRESDRRRRTEADYKAGWNSPIDAGGGTTGPSGSAEGLELKCMNGDRFTVTTRFPNGTTALGSANSQITVDGPASNGGLMKCVGENALQHPRSSVFEFEILADLAFGNPMIIDTLFKL
jgi:hypothetical protein